MSMEGKGSFSMALAPWEEDISLIDQNYGFVERENPPFPFPFSPSINGNIEEITHFSKGEKFGAMGLEEEKGNLISPSGVQTSNSNSKYSNANAKKEEHNAKERERRMKLSQTYFSLRSLLPNSRRSKKRWSSTRIIEKATDYIPTLEKEIEKQEHKKEELIKAKEMNNNQRVVVDHENQRLGFHHLAAAAATVSTHPLGKSGEVIIQICINQNQDGNYNTLLFSSLIHKAEGEGMRIIGASTVSVSGDHPTLTCHLHIQMNRSLQESADYESLFRKKHVANLPLQVLAPPSFMLGSGAWVICRRKIYAATEPPQVVVPSLLDPMRGHVADTRQGRERRRGGRVSWDHG